ncbi:MAG: O-methyltransferase [Aeromicrobium sp.]|uniref:O-methyltransferase n=1 Tax=Aeromicrobium sp. TaxID=1871063 RepID=UPI0039E590F8
MTSAASVAFAEEYATEDAVLVEARRRATMLGLTPIQPAAGEALAFLTAATGAKSVVEIGTGSGVSGLYLLRALPSVQLTSVDRETEFQQNARSVFRQDGIAPRRFRLIAGSGLDVMSRLADGGYDVVFCDADRLEYGEYLDEAVRLVRPGGVICFAGALGRDRVADPAHRDPETQALRDLAQRVAEDETLHAVILPLGGGLLAVRRTG